MPSFAALPGFRDFFPTEFALRAHITNAWREAARRYGYEEYDGPPLEPLELYTEKSGEEIVRQLYTFEDRGGRAVALRPEMTPSFARMVGARASGLRKPIRWFSIPQLFRYERMQRGRLREHFQWNVDLVGDTSVGADAEVLAVGLDGLRLLGLTADDIVARVNDRRLLESVLLALGVRPDQMLTAFGAIDKLGRDSRDQSRTRLRETGLNDQGIAELFEVFESPGVDGFASRFGARPGVAEQVERMQAYLQALGDLGMASYLRFDPTIVRGLAYYTGIVFEIFDRHGELRAICGGGRYDNLLRSVSDVDLPALGFGMGDVVLGELLKVRGLLPETRNRLDYYIIAVTAQERPLQYRIAQALRARGHAVSYGLGSANVGKQFKDADARGARAVLVLGPEEAKEGVALLREMGTGEEQRVTIAELLGETL